MSMSDRKIETAIVVVSIVLIGGLGNLLKSPVQKVLGLEDVSYEMPRPKASLLASLFELGDRSVSRKYINPFKDKNTEEAKKAEAKKAADAAKTVAQTKKAAQKKAAANKKPKVEVDVYGDDSQNGLSGDNTVAAEANWVNGAQPNIADKNKGDGSDKKENKDKLSDDQWRALILAQPTPENIGKLVAAFRADEISADGFYGIVGDLYKDNRIEVQKLGLMAAKANYDAMAFTVTAVSLSSLQPEVSSAAQVYLSSYGTANRIGALTGVLKSNDIAIVELAHEIVMASYKSSSSEGGTGITLDPRTQRSDSVQFSANQFTQFIPIYEELTDSSDPQIANLANSALAQMQNLVAGL